MSAPYRDFWIIVGLTVGAVVLASASSKVTRPAVTPSQEASAPSDPPEARQTNTNADTPSVTRNTPVPEMQITAVEATVDDKVLLPVRDIDPDVRLAFDKAVSILLAELDTINGEELGDTRNGSSLSTPEELGAPTAPVSIESPPTDDSLKRTGVTTTNVNMREGPAANYLLVSTLPVGAKVAILEEEAGWLHVLEAGTGRKGWVNGRFVTDVIN
ncbi:SH3 domain-containing protein [Rhizobium sp. PP-CC-2G-626]|nr:SH3 domain-containing protein [Rhizobium sp. PP-CC-2G-626]